MHTTTSTTTLSSPPPHYALLPSAAHRDVAGEIFVITADRGFHRLESSTAVAVFQMLAGAPHTIEEMATAITATHEVDLDRATVDIGEFVATLVARHIVQAVPPATFTVANLWANEGGPAGSRTHAASVERGGEKLVLIGRTS